MSDHAGGEAVEAQPPTDLGRSLRCCVPCRLVKTFEQFYEQARAWGCCAALRDAACSGLRRLDAPRCCPPPGRRLLTACLSSIVQSCVQGCENCPYLDMEGDRERVFDCTTSEFKVGCACACAL